MSVKFIEMLKREQVNLSRKAFAEAIGVNKSQVYSWYKGRSIPTVKTATKVCENLGLGLSESLELIEDLKEHIEARNTFTALNDPEQAINEPIDSSENFERLGRPQPLLIKLLDEAQGTIPTGVFAKQVSLSKGQLESWRSGKVVPADRTAYRACKGLGLDDKETSEVLDDLAEVRHFSKHGAFDQEETIDDLRKKVENKRQKISEWQYKLIHTIEFIYGSLTECPDDEPLLKELQESWD